MFRDQVLLVVGSLKWQHSSMHMAAKECPMETKAGEAGLSFLCVYFLGTMSLEVLTILDPKYFLLLLVYDHSKVFF